MIHQGYGHENYLIAKAALSALGIWSNSTQAESSVTAFGVLDMAARPVKNGDSGAVKSLTSDGHSSSRLGFRGVEELGA